MVRAGFTSATAAEKTRDRRTYRILDPLIAALARAAYDAYANEEFVQMKSEFPAAVPEVPVTDMDAALDYYQTKFGFDRDWGGADGGIAGISKGDCRMFLTDRDFRAHHGNASPLLIWINLSSKEQVDELYENWKTAGATIVSGPESKPWKLHEFTAADLDGNLFRVFYDFSADGA
jgi:uncharacterized glyoxalase superfamily protein PhnB